MSWDDGLTGTARLIAATDDNPLRVMAGPGTGKSFAMKRRVARLLESGQDPKLVLAVTFTRITFPYLLLITLVTLYGGILNALQRFATATAAPILLNFSLIVALLLAAFFPTAGQAAA